MTISSCLPVLRAIDITLHAYKVIGIGIGPAVFVCHKIASNPACRCDDVMHMVTYVNYIPEPCLRPLNTYG